jgi:outer membrane scaffolding protein for murein synthesis (MipA/OmpV family)
MRIAYIFLIVILLYGNFAAAADWLEKIRSYDMNDYSLGVSVSIQQNPYIGGEHSTFAYPYLTAFTDDTLSDSWFIIRDGGYGGRWITETGWELGAIGRVNTLGLGNSQAPELQGITDRKWTLEIGPTVGYRGWPVQLHWTYWQEVTGRHNGFSSELAVTYPIERNNGFIIPRLHAIYQSADYADYYFGVSSTEALPTRPEYVPGSGWSTQADIRLGYELSPQWLLTAKVGVKWLGSNVTDSPIIDRDRTWFGSIGLAYNADIFNPADFDNYDRQLPTFDIRVGAFFSDVSTTIRLDADDGEPGLEIDLEDRLDAPASGTAIEVEGLWRIGQHHRLELGYFELVREARNIVAEDLVIGRLRAKQGDEVRSKIDYSSLRFTYTFYLMRDSQKEFGVMAGLHFTDLETNISVDGFPDVQKSRSSAPLPVIGLNAAIFFGEKTSLRGRIHFFRTDFDQHEGSLNYASLDLERRFGKRTWMGLGYNYYGTRLSSRESSVRSNLEIRHHGPVVYFSVGF